MLYTLLVLIIRLSAAGEMAFDMLAQLSHTGRTLSVFLLIFWRSKIIVRII